MPLFPYLPFILWMGMIAVMLDPMHGPGEENVRRDPADPAMDPASIIPFPTLLAPADKELAPHRLL